MSLGATPASGTWINLAGTTLCMSEWEIEFDGGLVDVTSFCDGGYSDRISGVKDAHISIRGFWNLLAPPHAIPPDIRSGETLANLKLGVSTPVAGAPFYLFPSIIVDKVRVVAVVRDALKLDFDAYNRGSWTYA